MIAEDALGADEQLAQVGPGGRLRGPAEVQDAGRGDHPQAADHVVEPAVTGGVLAGGAGRREAADGGEPEALREMAQREAVLAEQSLGVRSGDAGAEFGLAGDLVEPVQFVEPAQVQRDDGAELAADRVEPADHAGAAAERHDRDAVVRSSRPGPAAISSSVPGSSTASGASWLSSLAPQQIRAWTCRRRATAGRGRRLDVVGADDGGQPVAVDRRCRADGRSCTSSMPGAGTVGRRSRRAPARAVSGCRRTAVWRRPGRPRRSTPSGEAGCRGIGVDHALQYYRCCQSVTTSRWTSATASWPPPPAACGTSVSSASRSPRSPAAPVSAGRRSTGAGPTPGRSWPACSPTGSPAPGAPSRPRRRAARPGRPDRGGRPAAAQRRR